ncbi:hypothetical protein [Paenibacillus sp. GCM10027626]|uniref:hypothetical protein n=1 Tax=Paenibacillus sp. GCM10027626 TaxID=3273411 RepID=UPI00363CD5DE
MDFGKLAKMAGDLTGGKLDLDNLNLADIITDTFIANNTKLDSVKTFIEKSGFDVSSLLDFKNIPVDKLDSFIKSISSFGSWKEMLMKAVAGK